MSSWVAISFGALDVRDTELWRSRYRYLVAPARPAIPVMLWGSGAAMWERLVVQAVDADEIDPDEALILEELESMGIASRDLEHPARVRQISTPWMSSPLHELTYSLLGRVAESAGVELVFIKGPTLHSQGLRVREHSGDVDCWVEPGAEERFARAMQPWGWRPAFSAFTGTAVLHSLTLRAPEWGCAVDVHTWFPGMAVAPSEAFAQLLNSTEARIFAGYTGRTPTRAMHAVIGALNEIRPVGGREADSNQIDRAAHILSLAGEPAVNVAVSTGAEFALKEPLMKVFPERVIDYANARVPVDWAWRTQPTALRGYVAALRTLPLRRRLRAAGRIFWPTRESLLAGPVARDSGLTNIWHLRIRRADHGLRALIAGLARRRDSR
ncbi:hypothetical protein [Microbacterium murale]|uniref:Nucleotidyltransferase family protein n=1 Tax=Microbacterium murale TaxID=1081040 RepID=A0ABU0PB55_9MICO|nr:hypothetical protein [Microbacterium murale]MDQ0644583.1 hypothetical protein [Microbacterium murale]